MESTQQVKNAGRKVAITSLLGILSFVLPMVLPVTPFWRVVLWLVVAWCSMRLAQLLLYRQSQRLRHAASVGVVVLVVAVAWLTWPTQDPRPLTKDDMKAVLKEVLPKPSELVTAQTPASAPPTAAAPPVSADPPALRTPTLQQETDKVTLIIGSNRWILKTDELRRKSIDPVLMGTGTSSDLRLSVRGDTLCVDGVVRSANTEIALDCNRYQKVKFQRGDMNANDKAMELVTEERRPFFQLVLLDAVSVTIRGTMPHPMGIVTFNEDGVYFNNGTPDNRPKPLQRIFKYPAWQYPGEYETTP